MLDPEHDKLGSRLILTHPIMPSLLFPSTVPQVYHVHTIPSPFRRRRYARLHTTPITHPLKPPKLVASKDAGKPKHTRQAQARRHRRAGTGGLAGWLAGWLADGWAGKQAGMQKTDALHSYQKGVKR